MPSFLKFLVLTLFFTAPAHADDAGSLCPYKREIGYRCSDKATNGLGKSSRFNFDPWQFSYTHEDTCRLWNWVHQAPQWHYSPLEEWAADVQDALREHVDEDHIYKLFKMAPIPPSPKADRRDRTLPSCQIASAAFSEQLGAQLAYFNFKELPKNLLENLQRFCLMFEVGTTPTERFINQISNAYVLPLGNTNFVFVGKLEVPPLSLESLPTESQNPGPEVRVHYFAAGTCATTQSPRYCVQEMLGKRTTPVTYAFDKRTTLDFTAVPFGTGIDSLFRWRGGFTAPTSVQLDVMSDGRYEFSLPIDGKRKRFLGFDVHDGRFSLRTNALTCNPILSAEEPLTLRLIAFAEPLQHFFSEVATYGSQNFSANAFDSLPAGEKRCEKNKSLSQWIADTANMGHHFLKHNPNPEALYREIAFRYFLFKNDYPSLKKADGKEFALGFRKKAETEMLPAGAPMEERAIRFATEAIEKKDEDGVFSKGIDIDNAPATEIWYYKKGREIATEDSTYQSHVVIMHQGSPERIYRNSVITPLEQLFGSCLSEGDQKTKFLGAMYAMFNAKILEEGSDSVGTAFMAAVYHQVFMKDLAMSKSLENIEADAITMTAQEFSFKYLPLL
jgi:hypothetical protein